IYGTVYRMILNGCSHSRIPFTFPTRRSSDLAGTLLADDEAGGQDHADNLLPRLDLLLEKRLLAPGRGVRDDDVEPAGVGVRLPHSAAAVLDVGELRHDLARNGACRGDLLRDRVDPVGE